MDEDSDSEETFVSFGTPLEPYTEDDIPKKAGTAHEQTVRDAQGRQRFHGAFTGGFSAGYFNTVGTKEGWTPSTYVSSRVKDGDKKTQRPEDFMDDEDLGEHGIAPRHISTTTDFASTQREKLKRKNAPDFGGIIPDATLLQDIVVPARIPIGIRLLRKLGWKEGQGIGPRVKRKHKRKHKNEGGQKLYGCQMPPSVTGGSEGSETDSSEDEVSLRDVTFAPKDVTPLTFTPKDNHHGLGYSGIDPRSAMGHVSLFEPRATTTGKRGMSGRAFGVGALEEDDDDIYATEQLSNYDLVLDGPKKGDSHGWTGPWRKDGRPPEGCSEKMLPGFTPSSKKMRSKCVYPPPTLPRDFRPVHKPHPTHFTQPPPEVSKDKGWKKVDASTRGELLGEVPQVKSVFELVSKTDQKKIEDTASAIEMQQDIQASRLAPSTSSAGKDKSKDKSTDSSLQAQTSTANSMIVPAESESTSAKPSSLFKSKGSSNFKPFSKDPAKQARYEKYLDMKKQGVKYSIDPGEAAHLTEWEQEHELEGFARAAALYRPLSFMMASRFTQAQYTDDDKSNKNPSEKETATPEKSDQAKAADMKMYGRLTREVMEWHPDRNLCKRFNVPNPYPDSTIVGLTTSKRDKYTVFNFLQVPMEVDEDRSNKPQGELKQALDNKARQPRTQSKPLAILASVDLTRPRPASQNGDTSKGTPDQGANAEAKSESKDMPELALQNQEAEGKEEASRPPIDLFKAIFEDTDTEKSSSDEETEVDKSTEGNVKSPDGTGLLSSEIKEGSTLTDDKTAEKHPEQQRASYEAIPVESEGDSDSELNRLPPGPMEKASEETSKQPSIRPDTYGPELPPNLGISSSEEDSVKETNKFTSRKKHKKKEKKKKAKHKSKKHKEKSKKKKKKHKKEIIMVVSSSGSDADSSSDGDDVSNTDLLQKIRRLPPGQRPSAADFM